LSIENKIGVKTKKNINGIVIEKPPKATIYRVLSEFE